MHVRIMNRVNLSSKNIINNCSLFNDDVAMNNDFKVEY